MSRTFPLHLLTSLGLLALAGCGPSVIVNRRALEDASPQSVALLPLTLSDEAQGERAHAKVAAVRGTLERRFQSVPYLHLDPDEVDRRLHRAGLSGTEAMARALEGRLHDVLDVDAYLVGELDSLSNVEGVLLYRQAIGGRLLLLDARTGAEFARIEHTESDIGGFLVAFSQSLEAVQNTLDNSSDLGFVRLAERFAESVVRSIPPPPTAVTPIQHSAPTVTLEVSEKGALGVGSTLSVEATAAPGLKAELALGSSKILPLTEEEPGRYRGFYRVLLGDALDEPLVVHVEDAYGVGASKVLRDRPVRIAARPPPAPKELKAKLKGERVVLTWRASERAVAYRVFEIGAQGVPRLLNEGEALVARVASGPPRYAVAGLDAKGNLGPLSIVSAPKPKKGGKR